MDQPSVIPEQVQDLINRIESNRAAFTLVELAEDSNVSLSWLSKFVNGKIPNPTILSLNNVAAALDKRVGQ